MASPGLGPADTPFLGRTERDSVYLVTLAGASAAPVTPHYRARNRGCSSYPPSEDELGDARYGLELARAIGRLDLGQTVVVKDRAGVAVEAMEGTDACIRRGGELRHVPAPCKALQRA